MTGLREPARRPLPTTHSLHIHTHLLRGFNAFYCKKGPSVHTTNPSCFLISFLSLDLGALIFRVGRFVHHVGTDVCRYSICRFVKIRNLYTANAV